MPDIIIAMSKQVNEDMVDRRVESERSIGDVLQRFDAAVASKGLESIGNDYYRIADVAAGRVDQLLGELRNIRGIAAAYAKPADELP